MIILRGQAAWNQGARGLPPHEFADGVLFVMPGVAPWPITMEGIDIPLDVYWLNEGGMVQEVASLVPGMDDFWPELPAAYVLELPMADPRRYRIGDFIEVKRDETAAT